MKKALITGVTGQDGSYLAELLLQKGYEVYGMVRMSSLNNLVRIENILNNNNFHILYGDMTDEASLYRVVKTANPDEIYNLAAQSHVGLSSNFSEYTTNVNALGVLRLINVINSLGLQNKIKMYQALTSDVFCNVEDNILNENTQIKPINPYSCAKAYALMLTRNYREQGMFIVNGIAFAHESKRRPDKFVTRKIIKAAVRIKYGKQEKLSLGNIDVRRDWGHAKDFVKGMWLAMQMEKPDDYVFATGVTTSLKEFCEKVFAKLGITLEFNGEGENTKVYDVKTGKLIIDIDPQFTRKNEKMNPIGDYSKAKNVLGWKPEYTIDDIINEMVESELSLNSAETVKHKNELLI